MEFREKLAQIFIKQANSIASNQDAPAWQEALEDPLYFLAGVVNGTLDFDEARIYRSMREEWKQNVQTQRTALMNSGKNSKPKQKIMAISETYEFIPPSLLDLTTIDPFKESVDTYLKFKVDEYIEKHGMRRKDAILSVMKLDLTSDSMFLQEIK